MEERNQQQLLITGQRLFMSYAREDRVHVLEIYRLLQTEGFRPWIDTEDIHAGQDWDREIRHAIKSARLFLLFLSRNAVSKAGYFQREVREALDAADTLPEESVFIVPIRLDNCTVPERVARWQWIDVFEPIHYPKLIRTLEMHIGEQKRARGRFPETAWSGRRADKDFARLCIEIGRFLHGKSPDRRLGVSDGRILLLLPRLGATLRRLQDSKALSRKVTTKAIRNLLTTAAGWEEHPVIHEEKAFGYATLLRTSDGTTAFLNSEYKRIVELKFPKSGVFLLGPDKAVVFGNKDAGRIDALVMPLKTGKEDAESGRPD